MLRLLDEPRDRAVLAPLIKREILWRLITGDQGAAVRQFGLADSSLSHVSRAVRWIREHYAQPFRVEDVARLSGMSVSAFYRNFQAVTAMSPIQFQKQIRLQEARLLLATRPGDITGVGRHVGYDNPSQFSREYRRQFGTPPSQDATRLRTAARAPRGRPSLTRRAVGRRSGGTRPNVPRQQRTWGLRAPRASVRAPPRPSAGHFA